ncbi:adult-specific cuticular protein ACP-22-like [Ostrinia furnacalis]|uniref:adult-specific cuticular protein ACP-22-like n=1 Tax=Ostrinia furnacalis TaxID=93504 RepID=UPI00103A2B2D|nr:adult-specific cuticular protein ACP-22-like [Ostrinia furnacalis]
MAFLFKALPIMVLMTSTLAQFEEYGFESHGLEGYHKKAVSHHQQSIDGHHDDYDLDYHAHPKYAFDYSVKDPHTGDDKEHWETRDGDKVKGTYTLLETDGTKRVVEYEADDKNGFNAIVHKIGTPKEHEEYKPQKHFEEYKPQYHEFNNFEDGFVPVAGGFEH